MNNSNNNGRNLSSLVRNNDARWLLFDLCLLLFVILTVIICDDRPASLPIIGSELILVSLIFSIRCRNTRRLSVLIMLILIIDLNVAYSICFNPEPYAGSWRAYIFQSAENVVTAKAFLLFSTALLCGISFGGFSIEPSNSGRINRPERNTVFQVCGTAVLIYALLFGIDRSASSSVYVSNTNVLYEYALVLFVLLWAFSDRSGKYRFFLLLYAMVYCVQGLLYGDRSSAFPMAIAVFFLCAGKQPKLFVALLIGLFGVQFANLIDVFRNVDALTAADFVEVLSRGFYSNTVSMSFYAGTAITMFGNVVSNHIDYFVKFLYSIILGGSVSPNDLSVFARSASPVYFNNGGGFTSTYFYFWFGYSGAIIGGYIVGLFVKVLSIKDNFLGSVLFLCVVVFAIRWYVYYPIALFRSAIFIPLLVYAVFCLFQSKKIRINRDLSNDRQQRYLIRGE